MTTNSSKNESLEPSVESIQSALNSVVNSEILKGSTRLQEFLKYVVKVKIEGNDSKIPAKVIAEDVYKRSISGSSDNDNVVRVDAGRLRRRLEQYYVGAGKNDPVRIYMDPGGYAPRFETGDFTVTSEHSETPNRRNFVIGTLIGLSVIAAGATYYILWDKYGNWIAQEKDDPLTRANNNNQAQQVLQRKAVLEKSQISLQAINLAEQARGLIFPIFDLERVKLASGLFRESIKKDNEYFGGYAGVAQTLAILALLAPANQNRKNILAEAQQFAKKAVSINPTKSWAQSAAAWVAFVSRDYDQAVRLSQLALEISPKDRDVVDFHGLISLFTGDFKAARKVSDPGQLVSVPNRRFASRNVFSVASFHLGDYSTTITQLNNAAHVGDPISALALVYLAAAYEAIGDLENAAKKANELMTTWPSFQAEAVLKKLYRHPEHANAVINRILAAGWNSPAQQPAGALHK